MEDIIGELMKAIAEEKIWNKFLAKNCSNDLQITKTPYYTLIEQSFAVPLLQKLLSIAFDKSTVYHNRSTNRAAKLIEDIALSDRLDAAYAAIDRRTALPYLRNRASAIAHLPLDKKSPKYAAGKELMKKLIRLSHQHNDPWGWRTLRYLMNQGLNIEKPHMTKFIFDVFCEMDDDRFGIDVDNQDDLRRKLAALLETTVRQKAVAFHNVVEDLIGDEGGVQCYRAFQMLRFFHHVFPGRDQRRTSLMEAAIMSAIFKYPFSNESLACAIYLRVCIEEAEKFRLSTSMIGRLKHIGVHLRRGWIPRAEDEAMKLDSAIRLREDWKILINRRRRGN